MGAVVRIVDANGETVTSSHLAVSLTVLGCNDNPQVAVNGVATFSGCSVFYPAGTVTSKATAYGVTAATSAPFTITAP